jgi:hypothetical protein
METDALVKIEKKEYCFEVLIQGTVYGLQSAVTTTMEHEQDFKIAVLAAVAIYCVDNHISVPEFDAHVVKIVGGL